MNEHIKFLCFFIARKNKNLRKNVMQKILPDLISPIDKFFMMKSVEWIK